MTKLCMSFSTATSALTNECPKAVKFVVLTSMVSMFLTMTTGGRSPALSCPGAIFFDHLNAWSPSETYSETCGGQVISDTTIGSRAAIFRS